MSIPHSARVSRLVLCVIAAAIAAAFTAGTASAIPAGVNLNWTQANIFDTAAPANTDRTWLGYLTGDASNGVYAGAGGSATGSGATSGATVDDASARGADELYTFAFPASDGSLEATTLAGSFDFDGTVTFEATNHGFEVVLTDPVVTLAADKTGTITASGQMRIFTPGDPGSTIMTIPYAAGTPVFNLDLSKTTCTLGYDGRLTLGNIVPSITQNGSFFPGTDQPGGYDTGAGPERTPNTFGSFSLAGAVCAPLTGPKGDTGAAGPTGPTGAVRARVKTVALKHRLFNTNKQLVLNVIKVEKSNGKTKQRLVGYATAKKTRLRVTYFTSSLAGTFKLSTTTGRYRAASVKLD